MIFWSIVDLSYKHQLDESVIQPIPGVNPETCAKSHQTMTSGALLNNLIF